MRARVIALFVVVTAGVTVVALWSGDADLATSAGRAGAAPDPNGPASDERAPSRHRLDPAAEPAPRRSGDPNDPAQREAWMRAWFEILVDPDSDYFRAKEAVAGLRKFGTDALPYLARALDQRDTRGMALLAIAEYGPDASSVADHLAVCLEDPTWRDIAASTLVSIGSAGVPVLLRGLEDQSPALRAAALHALQRVDDPPAGAVSTLVSVLDDPVTDLRIDVFRVLGRWHTEPEVCVPLLTAALTDVDSNVVLVAAQSLSRYEGRGAAAIDAATRLLRSSDQDVQRSAVNALGSMGEPARAAVPELLHLVRTDPKAWGARVAGSVFSMSGEEFAAALRNGSADTRLAFVKLIVRMRPPAEELDLRIREVIGTLLTDENEPVRLASLDAVRIGAVAEESAISLVIAATDSDDLAVRARAVQVLGNIGRGRADVVDALIRCAEGADGGSASSAIKSLGSHGAAAAPAVALLMREIEPGGPRALDSLDTLRSIGPAAHDAVSAIAPLLDSVDARVPLHAALALVHVAPPAPEAHDVLAEFSRHEGDDVRWTLYRGLLGATSHREIVLVGLEDRIGRVRVASIHALVRMPDPGTLADELARMLSDEHVQVQMAAAHALGKMGSAAASAIPLLEEATKDKSRLVCVTATEALLRIRAD